jgi:DNA-binding SARP family transcriptional activator/WD40 repeat protein
VTTRNPRHRLTTLGEFRLEVAATPHQPARSLGPGKPLALITFLAFAPRRTATRDQLCDLLWSDRDLASAKPQLRNAIYTLKPIVGEGFIDSATHSITLLGELEVDALELVAAIQNGRPEDAVDLYRGDFIERYVANGAQRFEEWAAVERARLRSMFVRSTAMIARRSLDSGRFTDAIRLARAVRLHDPEEEAGWRLLLESTLAAGDLISAQTTADEFELWLRDEGRTPEPASISILKAARRRDAAPPNGAPASEHLVAELTGREREFALLNQLWERARTGTARHAHIIGPGGHGKTRLVTDFIRRLRAGRDRSVYLKANFGERFILYSVASTLAQLLSELPGARGISDASARVLITLNPEIASNLRADGATSDRIEPLQVGHALHELAAAVAYEHPLVIVIDDLQWCDARSREALTILTNQHVLFITTSRPRHSGTGGFTDDSVHVPLAPLGVPDVRQLIGSIAPLPDEPWTTEFAEQMHRASHGSPLSIIELLKLAVDEGALKYSRDGWSVTGAERLRDALGRGSPIERRLRAISPEELRTIRVIALAGLPLPQPLVLAASRLGEHVATRSLAYLERRDLIALVSDGWVPAHDALGETVVASIAPEERHAHNAALGRAMAMSTETEWVRASVEHLADAELWHEAAASVARVLKSERVRLDQLPATVSSLLGSHSSEVNVERVRRALPIAVRAPRLLRSAIAATLMLLAGAGYLTAARVFSEDAPPQATLVIATSDGAGARVHRVPLRLDDWHAGDPITVRGRGEAFARYLWNDHAAAHPRTGAWAATVVYPDSGESEIAIVAADGTSRRLTHARGQDRVGSFSPDGSKLAILTTRWSADGSSGIAILDVASRAISRIIPNGTGHSVAWSPDGTQLAYSLTGDATNQVCIVGVDGQGNSCRTVESFGISTIGWISPTRIIFASHTQSVGRTWVIDLETGDVAPIHGGAIERIDASGRWALFHGRTGWYLAPTSQPQLSRPVQLPGGSRPRPTFAVASWKGYLDTVSIDVPNGAAIRGVPHKLVAHGRTADGRNIEPHQLRWAIVGPSRAHIDETGTLLSPDTGIVTVGLSAGGWRTTTARIRVIDVKPELIVDERWSPDWTNRWRAFGEPLPLVSQRADSSWLSINGDDRYFSGVYFILPLDASRGLTLEMDLSTPITRDKWQTIHAGFFGVEPQNPISKWDHKTGYPAPFLSQRTSCVLSYPAGEGPGNVERPEWMPRYRELVGERATELRTGKWFRYKLVVTPDRRCSFIINDRLVWTQAAPVGESRFHVLLQGNSVDTDIRVGRLRVWRGVAGPVDWETPQGQR